MRSKVQKFQEESQQSPNTFDLLKNSNQNNDSGIIVPDDETKSVIDKLADYVARNGPKFEECIKAKNDQRFSFLESMHPNYNYYKFKLNEYKVIKQILFFN